MNAIRTLFAAAPIALGLALSTAAQATNEERTVQGFTALGLSVPAKVEIVQGDREGLSLSGDAALLQRIETVVEDGTLKIRWKRDREPERVTERIAARLHVRKLEAISIAGSGDVVARTLRAERMAVSISGSGDVELGGRAESLDVRISGSGDVDAEKFDTRRAKVRIAGSGDATLLARETLEVTVAGSGDVRYYGDPRIRQRIAGSGSVRRAGAAPG